MFPLTTTDFVLEVFKGGCRAKDTIKGYVNQVPDLALSKEKNTPVCKDEGNTITITSTRGVLFDWGFGVISKSKVKAIAPGVTKFVTIKAFSADNCITEDSIRIEVDTTCGEYLNVQEVASQEIRTFVGQDNKLNVVFGNIPQGHVDIQLIDMTGSVAREKDLGAVESGSVSFIDMNGLNKGIYILRIIGEDYEVVSKLMN
jgi:hypothetical protein